jgi:hypothetical protein
MNQKEKRSSGLGVPMIGQGTPAPAVMIPTIQAEAFITVISPPAMGVPIMRDGFVTETGLLPSSFLASSTLT